MSEVSPASAWRETVPSSNGIRNAPGKDDPAKVRDAAQQFEALLLGQLLRTVRESGNGWLGSGGDGAGDCAIELAEQQLAGLLALQGGLGLASLIEKGLETQRPAHTPEAWQIAKNR